MDGGFDWWLNRIGSRFIDSPFLMEFSVTRNSLIRTIRNVGLAIVAMFAVSCLSPSASAKAVVMAAGTTVVDIGAYTAGTTSARVTTEAGCRSVCIGITYHDIPGTTPAIGIMHPGDTSRTAIMWTTFRGIRFGIAVGTWITITANPEPSAAARMAGGVLGA